MSKVVGILNGHSIYDNDPRLTKLMCDAAYIPVWSFSGDGASSSIGSVRCDYCGRTNNGREDCKSCGAPTK